MTPSPLCAQTAAALSAMLRRGETTSLAVTEAFLANASARNREVNAYLEFFEDTALAQAKASDIRRGEGALLSPLDGMPIALKDNIAVKGRRCACASVMLADYVSPYDAEVTEKLKEAGLPILGRLNMDAFGMGGESKTGAFGPVRHPLNPALTAGGSSGGAAAAVAAGMTPLALGSDTGGSARLPASFCGVVGVRPAYGTVSRYGLTAFASSMDTVGLMASRVRDAALLMNVIAGGYRDAVCDPALQADFAAETCLSGDAPLSLKGRVVALPGDGMAEGLTAPVRAALSGLVETLRGLGARVETVSLPSLAPAVSVYFLLSSAEAASNLARFDGLRCGHRAKDWTDLADYYRKTRGEGFAPEVRQRILMGIRTLSGSCRETLFMRARQARDGLRRELAGVLAACDALLTPTAAGVAYPLDASLTPEESYGYDRFIIPAGLAGLPALSLPWGLTPEGLPMGMQLMGSRNSLPRLLGMAAMLEATREKGGVSHG